MIEAVGQEEELFGRSFSQWEERLGSVPPWVTQLRRRAWKRFGRLGLPTPSQEEWKYTDVTPLAAWAFEAISGQAELTEADLQGRPLAGLGGLRLVFVNGFFRPDLSSPLGGREGLEWLPMERALQEKPEQLRPFLDQQGESEEQAFYLLNTAFLGQGVFIRIDRDALLPQPIQILYLAVPDAAPFHCHPRTLVCSGPGSEATLIESYLGLGPGGPYLCNPVTRVEVGENSVLRHYKVQEESEEAFHVGIRQVFQKRNSSYRSAVISLGGKLVRNDLTVVLDGEGAECLLDGLYLLGGEEHLDNHTQMIHARPHCDSREHYKGILAGRSRGVFHGRIIVRPGAQKTDSKQTNNNLLLSDHALINTKPQLEIYADDVKCTHGATIGQLDQDALFYLRSRGLARREAEALLVKAFAREILERIDWEPLRNQLDSWLADWLPRTLEGGDFRS